MINQLKKDCNGCHACMAVCPKKCITMKADEEGFLYPVVDEKNCVKCGLCLKVCCSASAKDKGAPLCFAVYAKDSDLRERSSSGGVFSVIADYVLDKDGVVFGAALDENFKVRHIYIDNKKELQRIRGSKYVQSEIGNSYLQVKELLVSGRVVLFSGTPCQVGGLKSYLGCDYDNLITCDFICHGVSSPMVFEKYLSNTFSDKIIKSISFRDKTSGWKNFSMKICFEDSECYLNKLVDDPFLRTFLQDISLRPSCFNCRYKGINRVSDFTLADFWGIDKVIDNFNDDRGVSALLIHSGKGRKIYKLLTDKINVKETHVDKIIPLNPSLVKSVSPTPIRAFFMNKCSKGTFIDAYNKYCSNKISAKLRRKLVSKFWKMKLR